MSEFLYDMYVNVHADILIWQLLLNNWQEQKLVLDFYINFSGYQTAKGAQP